MAPPLSCLHLVFDLPTRKVTIPAIELCLSTRQFLFDNLITSAQTLITVANVGSFCVYFLFTVPFERFTKLKTPKC